jgi:hypothetical protein
VLLQKVVILNRISGTAERHTDFRGNHQSDRGLASYLLLRSFSTRDLTTRVRVLSRTDERTATTQFLTLTLPHPKTIKFPIGLSVISVNFLFSWEVLRKEGR